MEIDEPLYYGMCFALMKALHKIRRGTPVQQITDEQRGKMARIIIEQLRRSNVKIESGPPIGPPDTMSILQVPRGPSGK